MRTVKVNKSGCALAHGAALAAGILAAAVVGGGLLTGPAVAQTCTTQSAMQPAERDAIAQAASALAEKVAANDQAGVKASTIAEYRQDFSGVAEAVQAASAHARGTVAQVEQVYLLDASKLQKPAGGGNPDAQFFCTLNQSAAEAEFSIPQLPPGRYGFSMVRMEGPAPTRLSFLLRQDGGQWLLAGFYPKALTAAGHDGLWYWKEARALGAKKEVWNQWLYLQEAQTLLLPANFVSSTHLDKLQTELASAAPPALSGGLTADTPLVVRAADGAEFRFTSISTDDSLGKEKVDLAVHLKIDALGDAATARKRNVDAMTALVKQHPELRDAFHGVWIFADAPGQSSYATELAMAEIK